MYARLYWYGHRAGCPKPTLPSYRGPRLLICSLCMPNQGAGNCSICDRPARELGTVDGYRQFEFCGMCASCIARIKAAGPPRERRLRANAARIDALLERFPTLVISEQARNRTQLDGVIEGRSVCLTIRVSAREGEDERYVLRVALLEPVETVTQADLGFEPKLLANLSEGSPKITRSQHRWLHAGFRHIGKLDILRAVAGLLATAGRLDARRSG